MVFEEPENHPGFKEKQSNPVYGFAIFFMFEYALARLIMNWGITPSAMIGHSFGEYVAACLAGVFCLEDAVKIIVARGKLFHKIKEGRMISIALSENDVKPLLDKHLSISAINGPSRCLVSGPKANIESLSNVLKEKKIKYLPLPVPGIQKWLMRYWNHFTRC